MVEKFETFLRQGNMADNTISAYQYAVNDFYSRHKDLNKRNLLLYKTYLIETFKPKTVNLRIQALNKYLDFVNKTRLRLKSVKVQQRSYLENVISNADYIFSDTLKLGDRTFADIAKPLMLHKGYLEDKLAKSSVMLGGLLRLTDRSTYAIDRNTNARNTEKQSARHNRLLAEINGVQAELNNLYNQQEAMKAEAGNIAEPKQEFALGGSIFACGGRRKYPTGGLAIPPLQSIAPTPQFAEMDIQTVSPITSIVNTEAMSGATMGANIIANFMAQDAMNKRQAVVSGLPPHIKDAVLSEVGMRCGGKIKKADGGSVQVSPFSDLNIQVDNPTKQMINPNPYLMTPMMLRRCCLLYTSDAADE